MTKEEFEEKMNRKNLGDVAEEKVAAFLASGYEEVDVLFCGIEERIINAEDAEYIGSILAAAVDDAADGDKKQNCVTTAIRDSSDAMNVVFMKLLHSMREEIDYSGLGLLYESCSTDLPFRIYQRLGDMIFNDYYPDINLEEHEKDSLMFKVIYNRFDDYFGDLITRADTAWASYMQPADVDDSDDEDGDLTFERFKAMIADSDAEDDATDDLMPSVVQLRIMKCSAYLMALSEAAGNDISNRFLEGIEENDPTNMVKNENHNKLSEDSLSGSFGNLTDLSAFSVKGITKEQIQELIQNLHEIMSDKSVDSVVCFVACVRRWVHDKIQFENYDQEGAFFEGFRVGGEFIQELNAMKNKNKKFTQKGD